MINDEDILAYMFKNAGIGAHSIKAFLKNDSFEQILKLDLESVKNEFKDNPGMMKSLIRSVKGILDIKKNYNSYREEAKIFYSNIINKGIKWTHVFKDDYPENLKNIPDPPGMLFYLGELPSGEKKSVAIIGARACSIYGSAVTKSFASEIAMADIQIISGLARGIDGISHENALKAGGKTFGILGSGVDIMYPEENMDLYKRMIKEGGVISAFFPGTSPKREYFPLRNRIISGLSDAVIVVEARKKSGTLINVNQALEHGRDVYAVPGRITDGLSFGCNELIAMGAGIAYSPEAFVREFKGMDFGLNDIPINDFEEDNDLSEDSAGCDKGIIISDDIYATVKRLLKENELSIDEIYELTENAFEYDDLITSLIELETDRIIKKIGNKYTLYGII